MMGLSIRRVWALRQQTGAQHLTVKWTKARMVERSIVVSALELDPANRLEILMRDVNFLRSDSKSWQNVSALSSFILYPDK